MKLYNRMMTANFAYEVLRDKEYVFLFANSKLDKGDEKRGTRVKEELKPSKFCEINYFFEGTSAEGKIVEGFSVAHEDNSVQEYVSLRKSDMYNFIEHLFSYADNLVVDFTLMNTRFLGAFCGLLNMFNWSEVYFCYTEPGNYSRDENDGFDMKNTTMGFEQIPSLETLSDSSTECDWVVFLGFEGSRLMRLEEETPSRRRYSLPHISIPAMRPEWHNYAIDANRNFFDLKRSNRENVDYVSAINPFETYHRLGKIRENNARVRLVISPIGPKPVILGCIMYVLENEDEMLLYDNPYQEGSNTEEYGDTHFYDLSEFVHDVVNKRYVSEEDEEWE